MIRNLFLSMLSLLLIGQSVPAQADNNPVMNTEIENAGDIVIDNSHEDVLIISNGKNNDVLGESDEQARGALPFQVEVLSAAKTSDIDPALIHAVIATESGYNPKARSAKGAYGLMQLLPATARMFSTIPLRQWSVHDQVLCGTRYLKYLMNMFNGDIVLALAAYNAGPQAVKSHQDKVPPFAETQRYVPRVLQRYHQLQKTSTNAQIARQTSPM